MCRGFAVGQSEAQRILACLPAAVAGVPLYEYGVGIQDWGWGKCSPIATHT